MNANVTFSNPMQNTAGIAILTARHGAVLVAECTGLDITSPTEAAETRAYLIVNELTDVPPQSFFLLASTGNFFLWNPGADLEALPNYSVSAAPVMRSFLGVKPGEPFQCLWRSQLREAIRDWLSALISGYRSVHESETDELLVTSGVYPLMANAVVQCDIES